MNLSDINLPSTPNSSDIILLRGGLDQVTPNLSVRPGFVTRSQNVEIDINQGYQTPTGYEIFDGGTAPSSATFTRLDVTITGSIVVNDVVDGVVSGAQGTVVAIDQTTAGQSYLIMAKVTGTFNSTEDLEVSATVEGNSDGSPVIGSADTSLLTAQYNNLAADLVRADRAAPTGANGILGLIGLNDEKFCFRNNAGGTAANLWKATTSGWTQIALGFELSFTSGGTYEIMDGDTITGATSTETAVITRVVLESGTWAGGDAAGRLIYASSSGAFQAENLDVGANTNVATIAGDGDAITLLPDGRYEIEVHNFGGQLGTTRAYGADGINRGFEFDGTVFVPIETGITTDTPTHVRGHKNHLFFSYAGSAQHSGISTPYAWTVVLGAAELAVGDDITNFQSLPGSESGGALAIVSQNRIHILYGNSSADWNLVRFRREAGAYAYTCQEFGMTLMFDDRGVKNLLTSDRYGNLSSNVLSRLLQPWTNERRSLAIGSCIARDKSQYRLFFSDNYALYITVENDKILGMMPQFLAHTPTCLLSFENSTGQEEIYFGGSDGKVYQMEKGTSFDGEPISVYFELPYHHAGSPRQKKRYQNAVVEVSGSGYHQFSMSQRLSYGSVKIQNPSALIQEAAFNTVRWDVDMVWDNFTWDGISLAPQRFGLRGRGENISLIFASESDYFSPILFSSIQMKLKPGKSLR